MSSYGNSATLHLGFVRDDTPISELHVDGTCQVPTKSVSKHYSARPIQVTCSLKLSCFREFLSSEAEEGHLEAVGQRSQKQPLQA